MRTAAELAQASETVLKQVTSGQIHLRDAKLIAELLEQRRRILETEDLEKRVRAMEQKVGETAKEISKTPLGCETLPER